MKLLMEAITGSRPPSWSKVLKPLFAGGFTGRCGSCAVGHRGDAMDLRVAVRGLLWNPVAHQTRLPASGQV